MENLIFCAVYVSHGLADFSIDELCSAKKNLLFFYNKNRNSKIQMSNDIIKLINKSWN